MGHFYLIYLLLKMVIFNRYVKLPEKIPAKNSCVNKIAARDCNWFHLRARVDPVMNAWHQFSMRPAAGFGDVSSTPHLYNILREERIALRLKSPRRKQGSPPIQLTCSQWAIASQSARTVWGWQYMDKVQNWSVLVCTWAAIALPGRISFLAAVGRYRVWWWRLLLTTLCDQSH